METQRPINIHAIRALPFLEIKTLSDLIWYANEDSRKMLADERFIPASEEWWRRESLDKRLMENPDKPACFACYAGAVIRGTLGIGADTRIRGTLDEITNKYRDVITPESFVPDVANILTALDNAREGNYNGAMHELTGNYEFYDERLLKMEAVDYWEFYGQDEFEKFITEMDKVADKLEGMGY